MWVALRETRNFKSQNFLSGLWLNLIEDSKDFKKNYAPKTKIRRARIAENFLKNAHLLRKIGKKKNKNLKDISTLSHKTPGGGVKKFDET